MPKEADFIILGAGMAGASLAAELAPRASVILVEVEDQPGRHATGRSAAMFFESYGNATVRALTRASRAFFESPPEGFAEVALAAPRAALFVADREALPQLDAMFDGPASALRRVSPAAALTLVPVLRPERVAGAALDASGSDLDVAAIHQGYLRRAGRSGASLVLDARETALSRANGRWTLRSRAGEFAAPVLVDAAGAWADEVAASAGLRRLGLQPMRRSALLIAAPPGADVARWPLVVDAGETIYFKPDAGRLLVSPANEDACPPCDAVPEEIDIALAVDRFERLTTLAVRRIEHRWAGLRSFFADRSPVAGYDPQAEGFFWLAGQGGYGIQMAPALARAAAALALGEALPADIAEQGVCAADLAPTRPALRVGAAS